ncbi:MAG: chemotaxis protein CheA [Gammaproteobacteria bacterium]|nr:chemotaxis protein CheA [Gammaproteobacteria bacterium]
MPVDVTQFFQTFFEESFEGLAAMESALLNLDVGAADNEKINSIFRAAHSIKGGAATFGFTAVAEFTHLVETLMDQMRSGERFVTQPDVEILLHSVDCMRAMLDATRDGTALDQDQIAAVTQELQNALKNSHSGTAAESAGVSAAKSPTPNAVSIPSTAALPGIWKIHFTPLAHLLKTGNDPVRMFRELTSLGNFKSVIDDRNLPAFEDMVPDLAYLEWDITLEGSIERNAISEVFEWVDGDCELTITAPAQENAIPSSGSQPANDSPAIAAQPLKTTSPASNHTPATAVGAPHPKETERRSGTTSTAETSSIRVSIDKIDALVNMVGELVITQSMLGQLGKDFDMSRIDKLIDGLTQLERNTRELQENVMRIRMLPISFVFSRFPRMVRDLSQKLDKKIELKLSGEQTELDKTVMEKIGDPLVHLVRNSVDHGVETPDKRLAAGKPESGVIQLDAYHQGGNIVIQISDDGAGINTEKVLAKARKAGLIKDEETPSHERIVDLIFEPGLSTAEVVSDVSGRGVGMDVVRRNIQELGGTIEVQSVSGKGSKFTIRLPLTLAILDGQLVRVGDQTFIVPLVSIVESLQVKKELVNRVAGKAEVFKLRNEYISVIRLYEMFSVPPENTSLEDGLLVVVEGDGIRAGLFVDDLLGQQQVVIKSLETNYKRIEGISGATILGDGHVALILDVSGLVKLAKTQGTPPQRENETTSLPRSAAA